MNLPLASPLIHLPPIAPGLRIGLFGGSFNPPHQGHKLVAQTALRRLRLDRIWWMVTPANPLKNARDLPSQAERMAMCRTLVGHDPRIIVTGFEAEMGTSYTAQTIAILLQRCPQVNFVWLMGADNLASFHRWKDWREIFNALPIAVIDRPGSTLRAAASPAARAFASSRVDESDAALLASRPAPAWLFLHGKREAISSTLLRNQTKA